MKKLFKIIMVTAITAYSIQNISSQTHTTKPIDHPSNTNQNKPPKDSIIKHQWSPSSIPDSLLFDGIKKFTFPKTNLTFTPPKTFREEMGNIIHDWTGASIQCSIINSSYIKVIKEITKATFEKQGFIYINQETIKTHQNKEGIIFLIGFQSNKIEYERMVCFIENGEKTAWININYPTIMKSLLFEVLENSLLTVEF